MFSKEPSKPFKLFGVILKANQDRRVWQYAKVLKESDINGSSRFLISTKFVRDYVMPTLENHQRESLDDNIGDGIRVNVFDVDSRSTYQLTMRRWQSNSFVLISNWSRDFVTRRRLAINNTVGFSWDSINSKLLFSVLNR